jgi:uncharacterized MAPEG superfamily protein
MNVEMTLLAWTLVLALVQILISAAFRTSETGLPYNASPRDVPSKAPVGKYTGRFQRAEKNLLETLPVFIGFVLIAHSMDLHNGMTTLGAKLYFYARLAYLPLYALGIPYLRTVVWTVSIVGIVMLMKAVLLHS